MTEKVICFKERWQKRDISGRHLDQLVAEIGEMLAQLEDIDLSRDEAEKLYAELQEIISGSDEITSDLEDDASDRAESHGHQRIHLVNHNRDGRISNSDSHVEDPCPPLRIASRHNDDDV